MVLSIALAILLALTLAALLRPLVTPSAPATGGDDREVYAAQLTELEADRARGLINETDAGAARTEIARRLLRARGREDGRATRGSRLWAAGVIMLIFVPAFSLGIYGLVGAPRYGDQPLAARMAPISDEEIATLLARAEARLAQDADDGEGWIAVAPVYQRLRRFEDAAHAYARANALLGEQPQWLAQQGESLTFANGGEVTAAAKTVFERALALDPQTLRAAIFLAIAARQAGDFMEAAERWRALVANSDGTEPWLNIATAEFMKMGEVAGMPDAAGTTPMTGPVTTPKEGQDTAPPAIAAPPFAGPQGGGAAQAPPAMVTAMVARLAARLESEGGSVDEWVQLVRSYSVIGEGEKAKAAANAGLAALSVEDRQRFSEAPDVARVLQ